MEQCRSCLREVPFADMDLEANCCDTCVVYCAACGESCSEPFVDEGFCKLCPVQFEDSYVDPPCDYFE